MPIGGLLVGVRRRSFLARALLRVPEKLSVRSSRPTARAAEAVKIGLDNLDPI